MPHDGIKTRLGSPLINEVEFKVSDFVSVISLYLVDIRATHNRQA